MFPINKVYPKYEPIAISRRTWCRGINFVFRWRSSRLRQEPQNATRTETWWAYGLRKNQTGWNLDECGACSGFLLQSSGKPCAIFRWQLNSCLFLHRNGSTKPTTGLLQTPQIQGWYFGKNYLEWVGEPCMKYKKQLVRFTFFSPAGCELHGRVLLQNLAISEGTWAEKTHGMLTKQVRSHTALAPTQLITRVTRPKERRDVAHSNGRRSLGLQGVRNAGLMQIPMFFQDRSIAQLLKSTGN